MLLTSFSFINHSLKSKQCYLILLGVWAGFILGCDQASGSFRDIGSLSAPIDSTHEGVPTSDGSVTTREAGTIVPTVYYLPHYSSEPTKCNGRSQDLLTKKGVVLTRLCQTEIDNCVLQGICQVQDGDQLINIGFASQSAKSGPRFRTVDLSRCPYGYGVQEKICLDPYHSVAADLSIYKVGDVIYIPAVRGTLLNDGTRHNGYFIVRDTGGAIKRPGRFDFYIGTDNIYDTQNPFNRLKLNDSKTRLSFQLVVTSEADAFKKSRNYPNIPRQK